MKNTTFLFLLLFSSVIFAQDLEDTSTTETKPTKEALKEQAKEEKKAEKELEKMAKVRANELQKELNLNNYASYKILESIIKYSKKANKVIQSDISEQEKTKNLSNIVYFQNEELKKVLTVHQFYKYLEISGLN